MKQILLSMILVLSSVTAHAADKWTCTAKDIAEYDYRGGKTATIRLTQYNRGGDYDVKLSPDGATATGKTGNGTPFTCTKS